MDYPGTIIVIDAIDGAGKNTVVLALAHQLEQQGKKIFDLSVYCRKHQTLPDLSLPELQEADVLLCAEPTFSWIGSAIRDELSRSDTGRAYDSRSIAQAFSLDRGILYKRIILPFLEAKPNRIVLQERGVISSFAYQPIHGEGITLEWLLSLEGNQIELSRSPEALFLLTIPFEVAQQRLAGRANKQDNAIFEEASFQQKMVERYRSPAVLEPYISRGTVIHSIDASRSPSEVGAEACALLAEILKNRLQ